MADASFQVSRSLPRPSTEVDTWAFLIGLVPFENRTYDAFVKAANAHLKALCVGRHPFLAEHFARFFEGLGIETRPATGLEQALIESRGFKPDVLICEYELLATLSLEAWEQDDLLSRRPVIAVSLSRRPHEGHVLDVNGIAGFLYLPLLDPAAAMRVISAAASSSLHKYVPGPPATSPDLLSTVER